MTTIYVRKKIYYYGFAPTYEQCKEYFQKYKPNYSPNEVRDINNIHDFLDNKVYIVGFIVDDIRKRITKVFRFEDQNPSFFVTSKLCNRKDALAPWWPIIAFARLHPRGSLGTEDIKERLAEKAEMVSTRLVEFVRGLLNSEEEPSWHIDAIEAPGRRNGIGEVRRRAAAQASSTQTTDVDNGTSSPDPHWTA
ncbi:hypothetical protein ONZ51_g10453 [Trametes cubensis]|uniref:Uncharacterized protein n=1 Tax=Trametes cubensis TaxID=1111947 RepID=A0AAD7X4U7_9APHY|nr:hypothetical protein ONZ51_g10453 [Trametes cubensis]